MGDSCIKPAGAAARTSVLLGMAPNGGAFLELDTFGYCMITLSLFSNTAATLLVGYKAW